MSESLNNQENFTWFNYAFSSNENRENFLKYIEKNFKLRNINLSLSKETKVSGSVYDWNGSVNTKVIELFNLSFEINLEKEKINRDLINMYFDYFNKTSYVWLYIFLLFLTFVLVATYIYIYFNMFINVLFHWENINQEIFGISIFLMWLIITFVIWYFLNRSFKNEDMIKLSKIEYQKNKLQKSWYSWEIPKKNDNDFSTIFWLLLFYWYAQIIILELMLNKDYLWSIVFYIIMSFIFLFFLKKISLKYIIFAIILFIMMNTVFIENIWWLK